VGRQPILKDKTSKKNRIKIQKRGKPAKKVFSFFGIKKAENAHKNVAFWGKS
jgi:hypothetical protein